MLVAVLATALAVVAEPMADRRHADGRVLGLPPLASALRLGPALAWQLASLSLDRVDWILLLSALPPGGDPGPGAARRATERQRTIRATRAA